MKINEKIHGFTVTSAQYIEELQCDVYTLSYDKNGARLVFLDREDDNKTFSISFKTVPTDNTGVFHILEHSVLCGSESYPVKDPFVELLKGSLNTFLNAMTFSDKTMYPVASRNPKDFLNLVGIYLDAVFRPLAVKREFAFLQEGWHYEPSEDGALEYKGVVLNEMRGDYSSADTVAQKHINEMLYPSSCYSYDSGGDPDEIVGLTYENFCAAHKKYYHPSNAYIFLDGSVDIDATLSLISSYLCEYEREDVSGIGFDIPPALPPEKSERRAVYEISPGESCENKGRLVLGFFGGDFSQTVRNYAVFVLSATLLSTNESEIKKKILASGLCEDIIANLRDGIRTSSFTITFVNVKDGCAEELRRLFFDTVDELVKRGIDREELAASINSFEFRIREKDYGTIPLGVVYAMTSMESYLYSDDPVLNFKYNRDLESLRAHLDDGYYERLLAAQLSQQSCIATLYLDADASLGERRAKEERESLLKIARNMSEKELFDIGERAEMLEAWQNGSDTPENLAKIPALVLSDISAEVPKIPIERETVNGAETLFHDINTAGIIYTDLFIDVTDAEKEELRLWFLLSSLLSNVKTSRHGAAIVQRTVKSELGSLEFGITSLTERKSREPRIYFQVSASALSHNKTRLVEIIKEILLESQFDDYDAVKRILRQIIISNEESFVSSAHQMAISRACAAVSAESAAKECYSGYESHVGLKSLLDNFDAEFPSLCERLCAMLSDSLVRSRLTVSLTGKRDTALAAALAEITREEEKCRPVCKIKPFPIKKEGIIIPSRVSYAVKASNLYLLSESTRPTLNVVRTLLGYEYLWNEIRVKGGAYGAGMIYTNAANIGFYSYRDPTPERTLDCYGRVSEFLRRFSDSKEPLTKFIIGALGDADPVLTPKMRGYISTLKYLRGIDYERDCEVRRAMLEIDSEELVTIAELIDKANEKSAVCIAASKEILEAMREKPDTLLEI